MARAGLTTHQRGYNWTHRRARKLALDNLTDGQPCARCGNAMYRVEAAHLDLDHTDDRGSYRGLAHRSCNRRAGQALAQARRQPNPPQSRATSSTRSTSSRQW